MKNEKWTEDLYLYRMKPAPPKKDDLQEYIALYCAERNDKYLSWFFHYYEPRLNTVIMQTVQENAMQGHFADLKQAYVYGIYKALQKYDISTGVPFLIFKEHYVKNEIDKYISTMRTGYSVQSVDEYRTLRKAMALYAKYEYKFDDNTISIISAETGRSIKNTKEIMVPMDSRVIHIIIRPIIHFSLRTPLLMQRLQSYSTLCTRELILKV